MSVLTVVVHSIDVRVTVDQLLHHALHGQPGSQDEGRGAVVHAGVQLCGAVTDQDLRNGTNTAMTGKEVSSSYTPDLEEV